MVVVVSGGVLPDDGVVVVVVDEDDGGDEAAGGDEAGGVTMTVSGFAGGVTTTSGFDGGVLTTAGGLVTTVGRSQAISPIEANNVAKSSEDFMCAFSIGRNVTTRPRLVRLRGIRPCLLIPPRGQHLPRD